MNPTSQPNSKRKTIIIAAVSIGAIIILALLVFFGQQFVGKAITIDTTEVFDEGSGGIEVPLDLPKTEGEDITLYLGANIGTEESVAYKYQLDYDPLVLEYVATDSSLDSDNVWGKDFFIDTPGATSIYREHATLDYTKSLTGGFILSYVVFKVMPGQELNQDNIDQLKLDYFEVLNLSNNPTNLITGDIIQPSGTVTPQGDLSAREALKAKLVALLDGECYTDNRYCPAGTFIIDYNNFNVEEKIEFLAQISTALGEFFVDILTPQTITCTDSDGGKDYFVKGTYSYTGTNSGFGGTDICRDGDQLIADFTAEGEQIPAGIVATKNYLLEFYCSNDDFGIEYYECPNGCQDGACVPAVVGCTDTDGGNVTGVKGTISYIEGTNPLTPRTTKTDTCTGTTLTEYYCVGNEAKQEYIPCDAPNLCVLGACTTIGVR